MAGAAVASIPQIFFYIFFRKKIIAGIATSGMKGKDRDTTRTLRAEGCALRS
jgi:hypothetical protein